MNSGMLSSRSTSDTMRRFNHDPDPNAIIISRICQVSTEVEIKFVEKLNIDRP